MRLYLFRAGLSILLVAAAVLAAGCTRSGEAWRPDRTLRMLAAGESVRLVAFGDSVTRGYGTSRPWPTLLEEQLRLSYPAARIAVDNAGVDGDTAADGLARLERDVLTRQPDLVLVAFGLNDLKLRRPVEVFQADLARQVARIRAAGGEVILLTTNPVRAGIYGHALRRYNEAIRELADQHRLPLAEVAGAWDEALESDPAEALLIDVAHPSERGHRVTAAAVSQLFDGT